MILRRLSGNIHSRKFSFHLTLRHIFFDVKTRCSPNPELIFDLVCDQFRRQKRLVENLGARSSVFNKFRQEFNCLKGYRENHWYIELQNRFRSIEEYQKHIQINPFDTSTPLKFNKLVLRKDVPFGPPKISSTSPEFLRGKNWVAKKQWIMKISEGRFIKIIRLFGKFFRFFFATPKKFGS